MAMMDELLSDANMYRLAIGFGAVLAFYAFAPFYLVLDCGMPFSWDYIMQVGFYFPSAFLLIYGGIKYNRVSIDVGGAILNTYFWLCLYNWYTESTPENIQPTILKTASA